MTIRLEHTDNQWYVVVNSVAGTVRENVTAQIEQRATELARQQVMQSIPTDYRDRYEEMDQQLDEIAALVA